MNILIVDDAADIRAFLKGILSGKSWTLYEASDGCSARNLIEQHDIDIVLTDWMMPGMNGIDLIQWIRGRHSDRYVYTILLTSRDHESDLIEGLSAGADDFLNKPVNATVLHARLDVAERIQRIQQDLLNQQQTLMKSKNFLETAYQSVKNDLADAARLQRSSLPQSGTTMNALRTAWRYRPATGISGDHFDVYAIEENTLFFYLLDVSGHGVTAALRSAAISQLLRPASNFIHLTRSTGPAAVLERLNHYLAQGNTDVDYMATIVLGFIDVKNRTLKIAHAGHPPALLATHDGVKEMSGHIGLPLSIDANASYEDNFYAMPVGSTLILHSDGVTDCENDTGKHFGSMALKKTIENHLHSSADALVDRIESSIDSWRGESAITDDQTLLVIQSAN